MGRGVLEAAARALAADLVHSGVDPQPNVRAAPLSAASGRVLPAARLRSDAELAQQAELFQRMILEDAMDGQGIVRHHLRADRQPLTDSDLEKERTDRRERIASGKECHPLLGTPAYAMYEDSNYCGNRFLMAMTWRCLALGPADVEGRAAATRAYQASILPAQLGAALEPGYWPKPYGGLKGENAVGVGYTETSVDQAYSPVIALRSYCAAGLASSSERQEISRRLVAHGHWWIKHRYQYDFLGETGVPVHNGLFSLSLSLSLSLTL